MHDTQGHCTYTDGLSDLTNIIKTVIHVSHYRLVFLDFVEIHLFLLKLVYTGFR